MNEFDEYLLSNQAVKSPKISKYVVIDSDEEDFKSCNIQFTDANHKILSNIETNLPDSGVTKNVGRFEEGMINKHIKNRKIQRNKIDGIKFEINKTESECEALEQLIEKTIKQEAELKVKIYNLMKNKKRGQFRFQDERIKKQIKEKNKPTTKQKQKSRRTQSSFQCQDIKKTIKTMDYKMR